MALTQVQPGMLGTPQPYAFKNRIFNGPMTVSQYNGTTSKTMVSDGYQIDRWYVSGYGTGINSATIQQLSASPPTGFTKYIQIAGTSTATNIFLSQSIETVNCADLAGQTVTLSFWYKIPVNWSSQWQVSLTWSTSADTKTVNSATGNGTGSFSWGSGTTQNTTLANTSTWAKVSFTFAVPSNALTVGVCFTNGFNNTVNGAQFQLTGVQLELGSTATDFDYRPYGTEFSLCQRYYQTVTLAQVAAAQTDGGTLGSFCILQQTMRTTPATVSGPATANIAGVGVQNMSYGSGSPTGVYFSTSTYNPGGGSARCFSGFTITASAEL